MGTEYFKHGIYSPFFSSKCNLFHNSNVFGSCIIHILYTAKAALKFGSEAWVLKKREEQRRSSTDEICETLTWNNKTR